MIGIYKITDGQFVYIGQSVNIYKRWQSHIREALNGGTGPLYEAMRDHFERMVFTIELLCDKIDLNREEKRLIQKYNCIWPNGFNRLGGSWKNNKDMLSEQQIADIQHKLVEGEQISVLCKKYNLTHQAIYDISNGKSYYSSELHYPLHKKKEFIIHYCHNCGCVVRSKGYYCRKCRDILNRDQHMIHFNADILDVIDYIALNGFQKACQHFLACRKTLRKFLSNHSCPIYKKDLIILYKQIHNIIDEPKRTVTKTKYSPDGLKVVMIDKNTNQIIQQFDSCVDAAIYLGDANKNKHISSAAIGSRASAYGYRWAYIN